MYLLQCFDVAANRFQVDSATEAGAYEAAKAEGAVRVIDSGGSVHTLENGRWRFGGTNLATHLAGDRAGSQNFSLINPPK